ncbi:MAG: hypothetical protein D6718_11300 [Acidobacteria bacterium]|nr:MAG: hypothetical protein D6718_11300 [Acidobacteriota bacterium]
MREPVHDGRETGAEAMRRDRELLAEACGGIRSRTHGWANPVLTLGRTQRLGAAAAGELAAAGVEAVGRPTGGGWLLHLPGDLALTLAVPGPLARGSLREAARATGALIVEALRSLGVEASLAPGAHPPRRAEGCFSRADRDEVVAGGVKVAGVAVARCRSGLLVQAAVPLVPAPEALAAVAERWDPQRARAVERLAGIEEARLAEGIAASASAGAFRLASATLRGALR